jgi:hypothetical protein
VLDFGKILDTELLEGILIGEQREGGGRAAKRGAGEGRGRGERRGIERGGRDLESSSAVGDGLADLQI